MMGFEWTFVLAMTAATFAAADLILWLAHGPGWAWPAVNSALVAGLGAGVWIGSKF